MFLGLQHSSSEKFLPYAFTLLFKLLVYVTTILSELEQLSAHDEAAVLSFLHATGRSRARVFVMLQFWKTWYTKKCKSILKYDALAVALRAAQE